MKRVAILNKPHQRPPDASDRLSFCEEILRSPSGLRHVLYSDEKIFVCQQSIHRKVFVLDPHDGRRFNHQLGKNAPSVMVWAAIGVETGGIPPIVLPASVTSTDYHKLITCVLQPFLAQHPGTVFQQDNCSVHKDLFNTETLRFTPVISNWPPRSPELSLIEYVLAAMQAFVEMLDPKTEDELRRAIAVAWIQCTGKETLTQHLVRVATNAVNVLKHKGSNAFVETPFRHPYRKFSASLP